MTQRRWGQEWEEKQDAREEARKRNLEEQVGYQVGQQDARLPAEQDSSLQTAPKAPKTRIRTHAEIRKGNIVQVQHFYDDGSIENE